MKIEVSHGEIVDKLTILTIKKERIQDPKKLIDLSKEYDYILGIVENDLKMSTSSEEFNELLEINKKIWDSEDMVRSNLNDSDYLYYSKLSHDNNEKRFKIKHKINNKYNSNFIEVKNYG